MRLRDELMYANPHKISLIIRTCTESKDAMQCDISVQQ